MKNLFIAVLIVLCVGCSSKPNNTTYIQESLLTECTSDTPIPKGLTGADVLEALTDWQTLYNQCRYSKKALIQAVRNDHNTKTN